MKKVIIVCLLSVSLCFSAPADEKPTPSLQTQNTPTNPPNNTPNDPILPSTVVTTPSSTPNVVHPQDQVLIATQKVNETTTANDTQAQTGTPAVTPTQNASVPQNTTAQNAKDTTQNANPAGKTTDTTNTTPDAKTKPEPPKVAPPAPVVADNTNKTEAKNDAKIDGKTGTNATTEVPKTTDAPKDNENHNAVQARSFDGASFVGGIILTLGLLAIGFMGFKYYKTQTERNYHTL